MKDVGIARKRRGHGRCNVRQVPVFEDEGTDVPIRSSVSSRSSRGSSTSTTQVSSSPETPDWSDGQETAEYDELIPRTGFWAKRNVVNAVKRTADPFSFDVINLFSQYETARSKFQVDVIDLAILTNFNVGKSTIPILSADPSRLAGLLGYEQWYQWASSSFQHTANDSMIGPTYSTCRAITDLALV